MTADLVRRILLGAAQQGLDIAGTAVVGPAWPVLRAALAPVLERLSEKLAGADPVGSPAAAASAADAFERDPRLAELLRSNLAEGLRPVLAGQERLDAGFQQLCQVMLENTQALADIATSVGSIEGRLEAGVTLSDATVERLAEATAQRTAAAVGMGRLAAGEARDAGATAEAPAVWRTRDELIDDVNRAELHAVRQIDDGLVPEAFETLRRARATLAQALRETPSDVRLGVLHGYLLKATAQASRSGGDDDAAAGFLQRAEVIFRFVAHDMPGDQVDPEVRAAALNGWGNVFAERGRYAEGARLSREATELLPEYVYAWHDLFLCLVALADRGELRPEELDRAWDGLRATAPADPELRLEALGEDYRRLRPQR